MAGPSKNAPLKPGIDGHAYDVTLADLAGTLALATYGTGSRALSSAWTRNFISATTTPEILYATDGNDVGNAAPSRADQDVANKQNLLLLLSRGYWSPRFLRAVTEAYWLYDQDKDNDAWHPQPNAAAKYAPAPNGTFLTDGILALTAALTTNPAASAWAFRDFQSGEQQIDGSHYKVGKFTHYLLFEHRFPEPTKAGSVGMTASLTALSSAITAVQGNVTYRPRSSDAKSAGKGPLHDSAVLRSLAHELTDDGCTWNPIDYWNCAKGVADAVLHWIRHWGHEILDILALATFAPPPFVIIGIGAATLNATWYAIDGDYGKAGLSLAAAVPGLAFTKIAEAVKAGTSAEKAAVEADDVAQAVTKAREVVGPITNRELAEAGADEVVEHSPRFTLESDAQAYEVSHYPGSITERSFAVDPPGCLIDCLGKRRVDVLMEDGSAVELKVGVNNPGYARLEVQKDLALLRDKSLGVTSVKWHFYADKNGAIGPSQSLRELLQASGIKYVMHVPGPRAIPL